ncbi:MAG: hypothetical protein J5722_04280 [Oscillospiraceae bacterium]|nr:hypothetical protein [Oscillospiraceae bacterium]
MNELEFMELLSEIPAEYVEAAAAPQKRRRILRKLYGIPVAAACIAAVIAAALYPRLRTEKPETVPKPDESSAVAEMTDDLSIGGTTSPDSGITVTSAAYTSMTAAADRSTTAAGSEHTGRTTAKGGSEPADSERSGQNGNTTQTTAVHVNQGQTTKTTSKQTTGPTGAVTPGMTARTTVAVTTRATTRPQAGTTAKVTTRLTSRTTARVTSRTTARVTSRTTAIAPTITTAAPMHTTMGWNEVTTPAPSMMYTTAPEAIMTEAPHTSPAPATTTHGSGPWGPSPSGSGVNDPPPPGGDPTTLPFAQNLQIITEDAYYSGRTSVVVFEPAVSAIPEGFDECPFWDSLDISDYTCLLVRYYGKTDEACAVVASINSDGGITVHIESMGINQNYCELTVLIFVPHSTFFEADACRVENITEWNRERYYQDVSLIEDSLTLEE